MNDTDNPAHYNPGPDDPAWEEAPTWASSLRDKLYWHDQRSQDRYKSLSDKIQTSTSKGDKMDGVNSDKVNIHLGDGGRGGDGFGGAGMAAVIAALGNRNQGNDMAGLIAALGNRNEKDYGPLMAMMANRNNDNDGMNSLWPILLLLLRGRGGFGDGGDCGSGGMTVGQATALQTLLEGQSDLKALVPEQTSAIKESLGQLALGTQQGFANVKDSIQNSLLAQQAAIAGVKDAVQNGFTLTGRDIAAVNQNVSSQGCQTRELIAASTTSILQKIDQNTIDDLRHRAERAERSVEVNALRSTVEINNTATATSQQAQGQFQVQTQFQDINNRLSRLFDHIDLVHQTARATNSNVIAGNTGAVVTGPQAANPTNVNA